MQDVSDAVHQKLGDRWLCNATLGNFQSIMLGELTIVTKREHERDGIARRRTAGAETIG